MFLKGSMGRQEDQRGGPRSWLDGAQRCSLMQDMPRCSESYRTEKRAASPQLMIRERVRYEHAPLLLEVSVHLGVVIDMQSDGSKKGRCPKPRRLCLIVEQLLPPFSLTFQVLCSLKESLLQQGTDAYT